MLHDIAIVAAFLAMLIAPCLITLRSQRAQDATAASATTTAKPGQRAR